MLYPLLFVGWFFWLIVILLVALDIGALCTDDDNSLGIATIITVIALVLTFAFTDAFAGVRPIWFLMCGICYVIAAVPWSIKKWTDYLIYRRNQLRETFNSINKKGDMVWAIYISDKMPVAADNKQRIVAWMVLWPLSFSWWVLTWPRRLATMAYEHLAVLYDKIAKRIFSEP